MAGWGRKWTLGRIHPLSHAQRLLTARNGHSPRASPQLRRAYGKIKNAIPPWGGGDSSRVILLLPQANNLALDTINKTYMEGKGWYAHILNEYCIFAGTLILLVRDTASLYDLNGFVEIAADSKTRTKSLGLSLSTMFDKNEAAD